ncbi:hypothetical protein PQ465_17500 [Sphingobacterium oryzagri]|uniref:Prokaryotic cytochrome C oxidase subunit IV n=1 Tax=Sphingobacterium oryzagri TaxID=3025669 RepID=A0ABY7WIF8_9SPHI|nr:hypothetical protein [Sphingobacterium sp. KACC 22765]WDF68080.1 hypothetical protein PQ465_17500 [Sphingobacterium sp. KACC 22765]
MKLTPLNIVLACVLTWIVSEWGNDQLALAWWKIVLFLLILLAADLVFRLLVKDLKKLWINEIGFILISGILMVVLKILWS